jgi:hypothetical protein
MCWSEISKMYKKDIEIAINNYEKRCEAKEVVLID